MRVEFTIPDLLYKKAQRVAEESGLSVEAYMTDLLSQDLEPDLEDHDKFFTPEVVAELHAAAAAARTGQNTTLYEYRQEAKVRNAAWEANHPG